MISDASFNYSFLHIPENTLFLGAPLPTDLEPQETELVVVDAALHPLHSRIYNAVKEGWKIHKFDDDDEEGVDEEKAVKSEKKEKVKTAKPKKDKAIGKKNKRQAPGWREHGITAGALVYVGGLSSAFSNSPIIAPSLAGSSMTFVSKAYAQLPDKSFSRWAMRAAGVASLATAVAFNFIPAIPQVVKAIPFADLGMSVFKVEWKKEQPCQYLKKPLRYIRVTLSRETTNNIGNAVLAVASSQLMNPKLLGVAVAAPASVLFKANMRSTVDVMTKYIDNEEKSTVHKIALLALMHGGLLASMGGSLYILYGTKGLPNTFLGNMGAQALQVFVLTAADTVVRTAKNTIRLLGTQKLAPSESAQKTLCCSKILSTTIKTTALIGTIVGISVITGLEMKKSETSFTNSTLGFGIFMAVSQEAISIFKAMMKAFLPEQAAGVVTGAGVAALSTLYFISMINAYDEKYPVAFRVMNFSLACFIGLTLYQLKGKVKTPKKIKIKEIQPKLETKSADSLYDKEILLSSEANLMQDPQINSAMVSLYEAT